MNVTALHLTDYRNIESISLTPDPGVNIIFGENGQGKTNILESIWMAGGFKSFRGSRESELIRFGCPGAVVDVDFNAFSREQNIRLKFAQDKKITLNSVEKKSNSAIIGNLCSVVFSPAYLSLVKGAPAERRRFCDIALCQINSSYPAAVSRYNKILNQRNSFLKDLKYHPELADFLDVWNDRLSETGAYIANRRIEYIRSLGEKAAEIYSGLSRNTEILSVHYAVKTPSGSVNADSVSKDDYLKMLALTHDDELKYCTTQTGAHRDDIIITVNSKSARSFASQGQQRSAALAMKLAEAQILSDTLGENPVILLDDVMSELDVHRQDYILNHIMDRQVFITCCEPSSVMRLCSGRTFNISSGRLTEE